MHATLFRSTRQDKKIIYILSYARIREDLIKCEMSMSGLIVIKREEQKMWVTVQDEELQVRIIAKKKEMHGPLACLYSEKNMKKRGELSPLPVR